jgi:dipeptidyl aminopeptidase/acylaminoacyl peptidase
VTYQTTAGNLVLNDMGPKVFADDSTNTNGDTRIILRSFSGCGTIRVHLFVSGKGSGFNDRLVRTVDPDGNGRFEPTEGAPTCDLNYNGVANLVDRSIAFPHFTDWHRNAMFGTLVRRTSLCETCSPESTGTIGDSEVFWSPDGKQIALTIHVGPADATKTAACRIFLMRSDPLQGNALTQFTFSPVPDTIAVHDYDPSWSPLGNVIAFDRYDRRILRKGIPGVSPDTSTYLVSASGDQFNSGDATPAISPDGQWVAFSRRDAGPRHLYKVPISGGTATQLTSESDGVDFYPQWSPSGVWITFDRQSGASDQPHHAYKVKYNGDSLQVVYNAPSGQDAATPTFSPDSAIVLFGPRYARPRIEPSARRDDAHV